MRLLAVRGVGDVGRTRHVVFCWIRGAVTTSFAVFPWEGVYRDFRSQAQIVPLSFAFGFQTSSI